MSRMFGRWLTGGAREEPEGPFSEMVERVRAHLPNVDDETVRVVAALAGLLGAVAYADRDYSEAEEALVRAALGRVQGMTEQGVEAVCVALRRHVVTAATVEVPRYTRTLRELGDLELRREVLDALVDVAAADGTISTAETNLLRRMTAALGLTQDDYNASQARHRDRLAVLKG